MHPLDAIIKASLIGRLIFQLSKTHQHQHFTPEVVSSKSPAPHEFHYLICIAVAAVASFRALEMSKLSEGLRSSISVGAASVPRDRCSVAPGNLEDVYEKLLESCPHRCLIKADGCERETGGSGEVRQDN